MVSVKEELLPLVEKASRYLGCEIGAVKKELADKVKVALSYPDLYEIGMSHLGLQILYNVLNQRPQVACERVFAPGLDLERQLRLRGLPLFSLESGLPLREFDILGFSLQYELTYTNILNILELAGIPFWARQRDESYPLILGGGPLAFNPEPLAPFFDAFLLGDGEIALGQIVDRYTDWKEARASKEELLSSLAELEGVYIPSFFEVQYQASGKIRQVVPLRPGYFKVRKALVPDLETTPFPEKPIVPFTRIIHDRLNLEIARGCTRWCRFCQAGCLYLPLRERSPQNIKKIAASSLAATGYDEFSLLSLSTGDYSALGPLLQAMTELAREMPLSLSLPSLRVGSLNYPELSCLMELEAGGLTLAPEAGSDRLRRVINKSMSREDIIQGAQTIFQFGQGVKLYFMIGLPREEESDLDELISLASELGRLAQRAGPHPRVKVSVSAFVPKAHTPFQWERFGPLPSLVSKLSRLRQGLIKGPRLEFKWHSVEQSELEAVFARGDRCLARVLVEALRLGCRFDGWSDSFRPDLWNKAFNQVGLEKDFYLGLREPNEVLPWDHLSPGIEKDFLHLQWKLSAQEVESPDCRQGRCPLCGVCDQREVFHRLAGERLEGEAASYPGGRASSALRSREARYRIRFRYTKAGDMRFLSHLETVEVMARALRRAGVPLAYSQGCHPRPLLTFATALPVGVEGWDEWAEAQLFEAMPLEEFLARANGQLPAGIRMLEAKAVPLRGPALASLVSGELYLVFPLGSGPDGWEAALERFRQEERFPLYRERKGKGHMVDLKEFVTSLKLTPEGQLEMELNRPGGRAVKPAEILRGLFGLSWEQTCQFKVVKARSFFKSSP